MRKLIVSTFASLDGIMQAPGGPEEDPTGGFTWRLDVQLLRRATDISASGVSTERIELVLGHRTYEIFRSVTPRAMMIIRLRGRSMQQKSICFAHIDDAPLEQS
jgi:hypothetical protein